MRALAAIAFLATPAYADCMSWGQQDPGRACVVDTGEYVELHIANTLSSFTDAFYMDTLTTPLGRDVVVRLNNGYEDVPDVFTVEPPYGFVVRGSEVHTVADDAVYVIVFEPIPLS